MYGAPLSCLIEADVGLERDGAVRSVYMIACSVDGTIGRLAARRREAHADVDVLGAGRELVVDRRFDVRVLRPGRRSPIRFSKNGSGCSLPRARTIAGPPSLPSAITRDALGDAPSSDR